MSPTSFEQINKVFGPPTDFTDSQIIPVGAYVGEAKSGSCDGVPLVVVAWKPSKEEIELIKNGFPIFITCIGGLPPHFLSTSFEQAINPA